MSRRKQSGEQDFGSDSFLDIIANIVGILIILIVVAGMKVARQSDLVPASSVTEASAETQHVAMTARPADSDPTDEADTAKLAASPAMEVQEGVPEIPTPEIMADESQSEIAFESTNAASQPDIEAEDTDLREPDPAHELAVADALNRLARSAEFEDQITELQLYLDDLQSESVASELELQQLLSEVTRRETDRQHRLKMATLAREEQDRRQQQLAAVRASLAGAESQVATFSATLSSLAKRQRQVADALDQVSHETRQLTETLDEVNARTDNAPSIQHRLSPVSQAVQSEEIHFRLSGGRIAHIPLKGLLERLTAQISGRRNVVMKYHRYEGIVGPVGGFRMQYVVQRDAMPPLQALQYSGMPYRMRIAEWTIVPAETLDAEPVDAALRIGSRFRQIIEAAERDTTITIWLYPNDFALFASLRELAHNLNLRVAARPLPKGTPIAASPNGSNSTSQ